MHWTISAGCFAVVGSALAGLCAGGCDSDDERPERADLSCEGDNCNPVVRIGGGDGGAGGAAGAGGASGSDSAAGSAGAAQITVRPVEFVSSLLFDQTSPYLGGGTITAFGEDQGTVEAEIAVTTGVAELTLTPAAATPFRVDPTQGGRMTTLAVADTLNNAEIELPIFRETDIDAILTALAVPQERVAGTAQIVIQFVTINGIPAPGVEVSASGADVIYSQLGAWTSDALTTDGDGLAMIINLPAENRDLLTQAPLTFDGQEDAVAFYYRADAATYVVKTVD